MSGIKLCLKKVSLEQETIYLNTYLEHNSIIGFLGIVINEQFKWSRYVLSILNLSSIQMCTDNIFVLQGKSVMCLPIWSNFREKIKCIDENKYKNKKERNYRLLTQVKHFFTLGKKCKCRQIGES